MVKYVVVGLNAAENFIQDRFAQSVEFDEGKALLAFLRGEVGSVKIGSEYLIFEKDGGVFFDSFAGSLSEKFLVIDLEQSQVLTQSDNDSLFSFQKLLRFAKKLWSGLSLTYSERLIPGSSKAVLFPYRYKPQPYRIVIEREPWSDRLLKREQGGNWLLAYKAGHESGDANRDEAELTNFRKAFENVSLAKREFLEKASNQTSGARSSPGMAILNLEDRGQFQGSLHRRYEDWMPLLTAKQSEFVSTPFNQPARIEGAAGTGKTLSLILKVVHALREASAAKREFHAVFITHSDATRLAIEEVASVIDKDGFNSRDRAVDQQSLKICTLSELCNSVLRTSISESELIDRDAMESKETQLLYISEAFDAVMRDSFDSHSRFLSQDFAKGLKDRDAWKTVEMLQHEISVLIKGRAGENLDTYKKLPSLSYGLDQKNDADKGFVFTVFRRYQDFLRDAGQFDTDDVVLSAIGQLDTPIWRRRRLRDGYDAVLIDETHLFNINELHMFHYFTREEGPYPIAYSVDRSQAVGDRGWNTKEIDYSISPIGSSPETYSARIETVFRSSPEIVNLAFSILSSGATLFTNFDNPLINAASGFTEEEERLARDPTYFEVPNEGALIDAAFERAEVLHKELGCPRSDILIVSLDSAIVKELSDKAGESNKPYVLLERRGDQKLIETARATGRLVIGHADYVGGLEFAAVILVGVDDGRVPPVDQANDLSSKNFLTYVSHNRLYVSVSRAKYRVEFLGEQARGPSKIIEPAIKAGLISID